MRDLFANDGERFNKFNLKFTDLLLDYSKHRINDETMPLLMEMAREAKTVLCSIVLCATEAIRQ